jgi:AcrR family transcriptional regulator
MNIYSGFPLAFVGRNMGRRNWEIDVRRVPVQERSRRTLEAILEGAARVVEEEGHLATAARIAERAGVSVGTLYQYVPGLDALLTLLLERHVRAASARIREMLAEPPGGDLDAWLEGVVRGMVELHSATPTMHRIVLEQARTTPAIRAFLQEMEDEMVEAVVRLLGSRPEIRVPHPRLSAHLLVQMVQGLAHHHVVHPTEGIGEDEFVAEVVALLRAYLTAERAG